MTALRMAFAALAIAAATGLDPLTRPAWSQGQGRGEPTGSACPDDFSKGSGTLAVQPMPGGGCDNTVYRDDPYRGGKRGTKPAEPNTSGEPVRRPPHTTKDRDERKPQL